MKLELYQFHSSSTPPNWNGVGTFLPVPFQLSLSLSLIDRAKHKKFCPTHWYIVNTKLILFLWKWNCSHWSTVPGTEFRSRMELISVPDGFWNCSSKSSRKWNYFFSSIQKMAGTVELFFPELELFIPMAV